MGERPDRQCFYIVEDAYDPERGYIPALVREDEPGYRLMTGDAGRAPWYWGPTLEQAEEKCDRMNERFFRISHEEMIEIVGASMALSEDLESEGA